MNLLPQSFSLFSLPGDTILPTPAPYVKVYLLDNGTCKAKKKTKIARKTLEPLYQQHLLFDESPQGKVLQVIIWVCLKHVTNHWSLWDENLHEIKGIAV